MRKITFRVSIVQAYLLLTILTTTIICATFYGYSKEAVLSLTDKIIAEVGSKTNDRVSAFFAVPDMQERVFSRLVDTPNIISDQERLLKLLWEFVQVQPDAESMSIAGTHGNYLQARLSPKPATRSINRNLKTPIETITYRDKSYRVLETEQKLNPEYDPRTRTWYKGVGNDEHSYWSEPYITNTSKRIVVSGSYPVFVRGERTAVVNVNVPLSSLSQFMAQQHVSDNGIAFLVSKDGELLAFPDEQQTQTTDATNGVLRIGNIDDLKQDWIKAAWRDYKQNGKDNFSYSVGGETYLASFSQPSEPSLSNWRIGILMPESDVADAVNRVLHIALAVAVGVFLASLYPLFLFARRLSRPIAALVDQTNQLSGFHLDEIKQVNSKIVEIDRLSDSIVSAAQGLKSFQKYMPAELVRQLMSTGNQTQVGGESRYMTVFFSDLENFSSLSETTPSREVLQRVSSYLEIFTRAINEENGCVDKFIGDSVMAFWGAPRLEPNHAYHACVAAIKSQRRMKSLNEALVRDEKPMLVARIGIHSDAVLVGNVGSSEKLSYTVMGDGVNIASRLEGINKDYGTRICVSHSLFKEAGERLWVRPIDVIQVKGRKAELLIYELIGIRDGDAETCASEREQALCKATENAFQLYNSGNYGEALKAYLLIAEEFSDSLSKVMAEKALAKCTRPVVT